MPSLSTLALFALAALALLLVPGPSVLFIVARSVEHGRRAGLVSVLGIHAGSVVHVVAAAAGLSALLASSALAFTAVKYAGAAYLVWIGVGRWRAGGPLLGPSRACGRSADTVDDDVDLRRLFRQGFVVNLLNPKTALFFLAFLPQFVAPGTGHITAQVVVLGLTFIALGLVSDSAYAAVAATLGGWLKRSPRAVRAEPLVSGTVYVGLGVVTAVSGGGVSPRAAVAAG